MQLACLAEFQSGIILKRFSAQGPDVVIDTNPKIDAHNWQWNGLSLS
jgi:hypothetical protein